MLFEDVSDYFVFKASELSIVEWLQWRRLISYNLLQQLPRRH